MRYDVHLVKKNSTENTNQSTKNSLQQTSKPGTLEEFLYSIEGNYGKFLPISTCTFYKKKSQKLFQTFIDIYIYIYIDKLVDDRTFYTC